MALDWLPAAVRDPHGRDLAWVETRDPKGVLHTTESSGWPSYRNWLDAPHATVLPAPGKGVTIRQHIPFSRASFALVHASGQQVTNTDFAFQFELVGTSAKGGPGYYWPGADDAVLFDLHRKLIKPLSDAYRIPLHAPKWLAYPASYGATAVRLSNAQWDTYTGWLGHQHVPQNDHGDPGAFPWDRMMRLATGQENDVTPDECRAVVRAELKAALGPVAEAVWAAHGASPTPTAWDRLKAAATHPAVPTAEQIAAAVAAQLKALPAGTATIGDADIAKLAAAAATEIATRLVR